jgi:hypothetical protein
MTKEFVWCTVAVAAASLLAAQRRKIKKRRSEEILYPEFTSVQELLWGIGPDVAAGELKRVESAGKKIERLDEEGLLGKRWPITIECTIFSLRCGSIPADKTRKTNMIRFVRHGQGKCIARVPAACPFIADKTTSSGFHNSMHEFCDAFGVEMRIRGRKTGVNPVLVLVCVQHVSSEEMLLNNPYFMHAIR